MEMLGKKIKMPTMGLFDFPKLILGDEGRYVDKTDILFRLASSTAEAQFFIKAADEIPAGLNWMVVDPLEARPRWRSTTCTRCRWRALASCALRKVTLA